MTGPTAVSLDELGQHAASEDDPKPNLNELSLEGEEIPEEFQGKTVADLLKHTANVSEALKLSEESRLSLKTSLDAQEAIPREPAAPSPPPEPEQKELTEEELATMYEEEPLKAIQIMQQQAINKVAGQYERRLQPLFEGSTNSAEALAKKNYPTEFELFEKEIHEVTNAMPDKSSLTNAGTWEDIIAYVRGKQGNFERYMAHMTNQAAAQNAAEAQRQQVEEAGFTPRPTTTQTVPQKVGQLDKTQQEIADTLGMSPEDYVKWGYGGGE